VPLQKTHSNFLISQASDGIVSLTTTMLHENLTEILTRIAAAAKRGNRSASGIRLVAVSKRVSLESILEAIGLGQHVFGENYVQEALEKIPTIRKARPNDTVFFHFIGNLQTNKAKKAAELFDAVETIDSTKLADALEKHLKPLHKTLAGYIQVNIGREKQKSGILPEDCEKFLAEIPQYRHLKIIGLMTIPPYCADPEVVRPYFRQLRKLSEKLVSKGLLGQHGPVELSMGMSGDFEVAIEEGATVIRIGTALFGSRLR
jgi:pyridoxal phosphate enzyme (YggS family)